MSYKGRLFLLAGHDSADGKILLKECATGQLKKFSLSVILEQTAGDFGEFALTQAVAFRGLSPLPTLRSKGLRNIN